MKRLVALFAVFCVALSLCGCDENTAQNKIAPIYETKKLQKGKQLSGDELITVAQNAKFRLEIIPSNGYFQIVDLSDGYIYSSFPTLQNELSMNPDTVSEIKSVVSFEYGDLTNRVTANANSYTDSVGIGGYSVYESDNGFIAYYNFPTLSVTIPFAVILDEQGFRAEIIVDKIKEDGKFTVTKIKMLGHFSSGSYRDNGYMVVPDGSGAVINFSNGKHTYPSLNMSVYGDDLTLGVASVDIKSCYMPIFALKNGNHSYLAIIEKGDANSYINASVSANEQSFNRAYASFVIRDEATVSVGTTSVGYSNKTFTIYDEAQQSLNAVSVKYILLSNDASDYTGMAKAYNTYLTNAYGKKPQQTDRSLLHLNMVCSVNVERNVLGFKHNASIATASFKGIEKLVDSLNDSGVEAPKIRLENWNKSDAENLIFKNGRHLSVLGKKSEMESLYSTVNSFDGKLYATVDLFHITPSNKYGARTINKRLVEIYPVLQNKLEYDKSTDKQTVLSPVFIEKSVNTYIDSLPQYVAGLSLGTQKNILYSDFGDNYSKRQNTAKVLKSIYEGSTSRGLCDIKPAAYLAPYLETAFHLGGEFLHYDIEDYGIPFYQLALSGITEYSGAPINLSSDNTLSLMNSLEYGASLYYTLITENASIISRSDNTELYNCDAQKLLAGIIDNYNEAQQFYQKVGNSLISHNRLDSNVYLSEYTNGKAVFNYSKEAFEYNGAVVDGGSYMIIESGVEQ